MEEVLGSCLGAEMGEETVEMGMVEGWGYPKVLWGGRVFFLGMSWCSISP